MCADLDAGEVVLLVDFPGMRNGAVHDVVHGPQGDPVIEEVAKQFDHTAGDWPRNSGRRDGPRSVFPAGPAGSPRC